MDLEVNVVTDLSGPIKDAVSFETGLTKAQLADVIGYEHHGLDFTSDDRGALPAFFEDLLLGRPLPPKFATPRIHDVDTLMAIALFLHRDLVIHPNTPAFVSIVDFVHRRGLPALAHIEEPLARFISALRAYFPDSGLSRRELGDRIVCAVGWLREYIQHGTIPILGPTPNSSVRILDQGTVGFAVAETAGSLWDGWVELYRLGFLRGVLFSTAQNDRRSVLIARKSHHVEFNLSAAARLLNQVEVVMGEAPEWSVTLDGLWLERPAGTLILVKDVLAILTQL